MNPCARSKALVHGNCRMLVGKPLLLRRRVQLLGAAILADLEVLNNLVRDQLLRLLREHIARCGIRTPSSRAALARIVAWFCSQKMYQTFEEMAGAARANANCYLPAYCF